MYFLKTTGKAKNIKVCSPLNLCRVLAGMCYWTKHLSYTKNSVLNPICPIIYLTDATAH